MRAQVHPCGRFRASSRPVPPFFSWQERLLTEGPRTAAQVGSVEADRHLVGAPSLAAPRSSLEARLLVFCSLPPGRVRLHALPLAFGGKWGAPRWWERGGGGGGPAHLTFNSERLLLAAKPPPPLSANLGGWRTRGRGAGPQQRQAQSAQAPVWVFDFFFFFPALGAPGTKKRGACAHAPFGAIEP